MPPKKRHPLDSFFIDIVQNALNENKTLRQSAVETIFNLFLNNKDNVLIFLNTDIVHRLCECITSITNLDPKSDQFDRARFRVFMTFAHTLRSINHPKIERHLEKNIFIEKAITLYNALRQTLAVKLANLIAHLNEENNNQNIINDIYWKNSFFNIIDSILFKRTGETPNVRIINTALQTQSVLKKMHDPQAHHYLKELEKLVQSLSHTEQSHTQQTQLHQQPCFFQPVIPQQPPTLGNTLIVVPQTWQTTQVLPTLAPVQPVLFFQQPKIIIVIPPTTQNYQPPLDTNNPRW